MHEEEFPELVELRAMQQRRHRQVIGGLIAGGIVAVAGGLAIFAFSGGEQPAMGGGAVAVVLIGVGVLMIGRAILSAVTDIDLRPRNDLVAPDLPDEDEPGPGAPP